MVARSILFIGLLISSFATVVDIKGAEEFSPNESRRDRDSVDSDPGNQSTQPIDRQRYFIIDRALKKLGASADEQLREIMTNLTLGFDEDTIINLVTAMVEDSPTNNIDYDICLEKLTDAIPKHEKKCVAALKIKRLAKMIFENSASIQESENSGIVASQQPIPPVAQASASSAVAAPQQSIPRNIPKYPLLVDVFHPNKAFFEEAAQQLKAGEFRREFPKGVLFYGPPGVGKNEMINALVNESGCHIFSIGATEFVNKYQGSGAGTVASIFNQAKTIDPNKGVIVLIDELQSLTPLTRDKEVQIAHTRSGQDYDNALTQLWLEYDRCLNNHNNIMIIGTCNEFHRIDERVRGRFECIEFFYPDKQGTYEILKNKANYFDVTFSEEELKSCVKKVNGLNGRDLTKFIKNVKQEIRRGQNKNEAIKLALQRQSKTTDDAKESSDIKFNFKNEAARETLRGTANTLGAGIASGILKAISLGFSYLSNQD